MVKKVDSSAESKQFIKALCKVCQKSVPNSILNVGYWLHFLY